MKKIHINKFIILFIYIFVITRNIQCDDYSKEKANTIQNSEYELSNLITEIRNNLKNSSVLDDFEKEQEYWEKYKEAHIATLFPKYIDGVKMEWGSILSDEMAKEILEMNNERIKILKEYLDTNRETGTDGKGDYKEYVEELRNVLK